MINKQSNTYTIIYIIGLVVLVGAALGGVSMALKPQQLENADADKMRQILLSAHIPSERATVVETFHRFITEEYAVNANGEKLEGVDPFAIDMAVEMKKPLEKRQLPVYVCSLGDNDTKYILPLAGMGLWGPIWGYIAFDSDGDTIYGAFFDHQGETPGLGAEITKPDFTDQFIGKKMFHDGKFLPVTVVKAGQKPAGDMDYVDGVSGGTITSKGVAAMLDDCLIPYSAFLSELAGKSAE